MEILQAGFIREIAGSDPQKIGRGGAERDNLQQLSLTKHQRRRGRNMIIK
jgi:hypothetical protein